MIRMKTNSIAMIIVALALGGGGGSRADATTYHVDGTLGDDSNVGDADHPFRTIQKANVTVAPGDSVLVAGGVYYDTIHPQSGGADGAWITYRSVPMHAAVLEGGVPLDTAGAEGATWEQVTSEDGNIWRHLLIRPLFVQAMRNGEWMPSPIDYYPTPTEWEPGMSRVSVDTLFVWLEDENDTPVYDEWHVLLTSGVRLNNHQDYVRVEGFTVQHYANSGISVTAGNIEIRHNRCFWNGRSGIGVTFCGVTPVLIEGNECAYNSWGIGFTSGITTYRCQGHQVYFIGNFVHHTFDGGPVGTDGNGLMIDTSDDNGLGGATLINNVSYMNAGAGIGVNNSGYCTIIHNTTFNNIQKESTSWGSELFIGDCDTISGNHVLVRNNIFAVRPGTHRRTINMTYHHPEQLTDFHIDHNLHFRFPAVSDTTQLIRYSEKDSQGHTIAQSEMDLSAWQAFDDPFPGFAPQGEGAIFAEPRLMNYATGNYQLLSDSPAIDAGVVVDLPFGITIDSDIAMRPRSMGEAPDMGAWEYDGMSGTPPTPAASLGLEAWPNPFNPSVALRFALDRSAAAEVSIYDLRGRVVRRLLPETRLPAGPRTIIWDGRGDDGAALASGIYLAVLRSEGRRICKTVTLIK